MICNLLMVGKCASLHSLNMLNKFGFVFECRPLLFLVFLNVSSFVFIVRPSVYRFSLEFRLSCRNAGFIFAFVVKFSLTDKTSSKARALNVHAYSSVFLDL
jgi:hypothetical protein